ncbi:MAG: 3',5'-cyclic-nucleotide phosphodiesterase [Acidobacteriota bacterium]|jgi:cAMP phosphodiesterase|nr:3',5'-cyclic-nucleotide phosphodiesterase [Acidobacteriota bacterium]
MKFQLLPSSFNGDGLASAQQHLSCFVIDDFLAIDAGSLAIATSEVQKKQIRDVVLTHAHLDHIAGLPLFIDDLFVTLKKPICVYATQKVIDILERDIFNWEIYPKFSELKNGYGKVLNYFPFEIEKEFLINNLSIKAIEVNHQVQTVGFVISNGKSTVAFSGDTAETSKFWEVVNTEKFLSTVFIECAFPNELRNLADASHHLTPQILEKELKKFKHSNCLVYIINLKPMYRDQIVREIKELKNENLKILEVGKVYDF